MFATIRRYESTDQARISELVKQDEETFLPSLTELPGFSGYSLIEAGNGVCELDQLLRHLGARRRVDPPRIQLGARAEARDGAERAEDHQRRGRRVQGERARPRQPRNRFTVGQKARFGGPSLCLEVLLGPLKPRFPRGELLLGRLELDQRW